jgi:mono/diheme cytochrome c family protein
MKRHAFTFARLVLAFFAISFMEGCSGRAATEDADPTGDLGARPAAPADVAPAGGAAGAADSGGAFTDAMVEEGRRIYTGVGICAACHGPDGGGAIGPNLTDSEWLIGEGEYEQLVTQITEGVSAAEATNAIGAIMPPKGGAAITDAQVRAVAAFVWTLSH